MRPRYSILRPGPAIGCHSNCRLLGWGGALVAGTPGRRWGRRRLLAVCGRVGWRPVNRMCGRVFCDPSTQGWLI